MNSFRSMATAVRKSVFRRSIRQQTRKLDPVIRTALAEDIADNETDLERDLQQIEAELEQATSKLAETEQKEIFLGQRSRQYQVALDDRARSLRQEQRELEQVRQANRRNKGKENGDDDDDDDNDAVLGDVEQQHQAEWRKRSIDLEQRVAQWERDEDALVSVLQTHKTILAECERMRRKIKELEHKRNQCRSMATDVEDFLTTAAAATADHNLEEPNHNINSADEDDDEDDDDKIKNDARKQQETELRTLVPSSTVPSSCLPSKIPFNAPVSCQEDGKDEEKADVLQSSYDYDATITTNNLEDKRQASVVLHQQEEQSPLVA